MKTLKGIVIVALFAVFSFTFCDAKEVGNKDSVSKDSINQESNKSDLNPKYDKIDSKSTDSNKEILILVQHNKIDYKHNKTDSNSKDSINKESTPKSPKGLKYYPQTKDELFKLARDNNINLADIDTSKIKDMSYLFADIEKDICNEVKSEYEKDKEGFIHSNAESHNLSYKEVLKFVENTLKACEYPAREDFSGIESWDTLNATDMSYMFWDAKSFNQNINSWNVSRVTNMKYMFSDATSFNKPLDKWDTRNVENMESMFSGAVSFNQPLDKWNVSNVKDMRGMFSVAKSFNQPLDKWDTSSVTKMSFMFDSAKSFNQPLDKWDTSNVENMSYMFYDAKSFNQNLESWGDKINKDCKIDSMFDSSPLESNPLESNPPKWYKERMGG